MSVSDANEAVSLMEKARHGDGESLGALLQLYRNYLHLLARTQIDLHLQGRINPSDVVQETYLLACRHFQRFRGQSEQELLAWLRRILVRGLARQVEKQLIAQKRSALREVSLQGRLEQLNRSADRIDAALASSAASPSAEAQRRELSAMVADQLAQLPRSYRDVLVLRNLEGHSFDEVARRMGKSQGAVRILWLRALRRFREISGRCAQ